eukprot:TCONS_00044207-protein
MNYSMFQNRRKTRNHRFKTQSMFGTPEKLESRRNHITITCDQETGSSPYHSNGGGNHSDDTPTKSNLVETCGLNLLNVKKSINFGLSRENSSDSFIQRDTATKKNLFFEVENLKFEGIFAVSYFAGYTFFL